jgi:hypothetical protein
MQAMSSFPPSNWDVRSIDDFDTLTVPAPAGSKFHLQALLTGRPSNGREGQFRFLIAGTDHFKINVKATDILDVPLMEGMLIRCQMELGSQVLLLQNFNKHRLVSLCFWTKVFANIFVPNQVVLGNNSSTSRWVDVGELAQAQDVEVVNDKDEDVTEQFIANLETIRKGKDSEQLGNYSLHLYDSFNYGEQYKG